MVACKDRKEYFCAHSFDCGAKLCEFFVDPHMINALLYLITLAPLAPDSEEDGLAGRWAGKHVAIVGDYGDEERYPRDENGWIDVGDELSKKVYGDDEDLEWTVACEYEDEFVTMRAGDPLLFYLITDPKANGRGGGDLCVDDNFYFGRWCAAAHTISATVTKKRRRDGDITADANRAKDQVISDNFD